MGPIPGIEKLVREFNASLDFPAPHTVTMEFDPATSESHRTVDEASSFAASPERRGRSRRTVRHDRGEAVWEFENVSDAVAFKLKYC